MTQASEKSTKKCIWQTAMILIIAVLLLASLGYYITSGLLLDRVNSMQINGITIKAEDSKARWFRNHFELTNIEIIDTANNSLNIAEIRLDGLHYLKLIFGKTLELNKLTISSPHLKLKMPFQLPASDSNAKPGIAAYEMFINKIELKDSKINISQHNGIMQFTGLEVSIQNLEKNVKTDSLRKQFDFADLKISADEFQNTFKDSLYMFLAEQLTVSSREKRIKIDEASIVSNFSKYEIGHHTGVETDWYNIVLGAINMDGFELDALKADKSVQLAFVSFEKFEAEIFRDKRLPFPDKHDTKLPMEIINSLPFMLHIDSVLIKDGKVKYEEHVKDATSAGSIEFTKLSSRLYEISNNEKLIDAPTLMKADAHVMGGPLLVTEFEFPNTKFPVEYRVSGSMQQMDMELLNPILRSNMAAEIEGGRINTFRFNFRYNNELSRGSLLMEYSNLKVDLIDREDGSVKKLKSLLINGIAVRNSNQRTENNFQAGEIGFERHKKKSFFNYWWKSLSSGIKSVVVRF